MSQPTPPSPVPVEYQRPVFDVLDQHFVVTLVRTQDKSGKFCPLAGSGFLLSVDGQWVVCTAGHALQDIQLRLDRGDILRGFALTIRHRFKVGDIILLDWNECQPWFQYDKPRGIDWGAIFLSDAVKKRLAVAGKIAAEGTQLDDGDVTAPWYFLHGVPQSRWDETPEALSATVMMLPVERLSEKPDIISYEPTVPTFYGRLRDPKSGSVVGCSGGPIYAVHEVTTEGVRYAITALQSMQSKYDPEIICAPLVMPIVQLIREEIARRRANPKPKTRMRVRVLPILRPPPPRRKPARRKK